MTLSEFCIRRPVFTILLTLAIIVGGIAGYRTLAISALPRVDFPTIQITATLPGASPETMAASVATPLERQFSTIAGVESITSSSFLGSTQITLQFNLDRAIDGAALDVQTAIAATARRLPPEMTSPPSFSKVNPADQPILFIAVASDALPITQINEYADTLLSQRIATLPGVARVQIFGQRKYAVRIQADPQLMAARDIDFDEARRAVTAAASIAPVGAISGAKQLFNLTVAGQPKDAAGFRPVVVAWRNGAPVRLQDVADVADSVEDERTFGAIDGRNSVVIAIQRQPDANTIDVVNRVRALLPMFRAQLPASVTLTPLFDRSASIRHAVDDVQFTLLLTVVLVVLVIFLFLRRVTATMIPAITVPLSIIATYGGMALFGFSINNVSLLALTLCVGFVVDDAIVMLENIMRHIEQGMRPFEAALKGAREISFTIISITFSLVAVFIPVLFMGGVVGRLFREFAVTISFAILVSGLIALTLTPMLCSRLLRAHQEDHEESRLGRWLERGFKAMLRLYEITLRPVLQHRRITWAVTLLTLAASIGAFIDAPKGFFPLEDTGYIFGSTEAAQDISFAAMVEKQKQAAAIIKQDPAVLNVLSVIGGGRGALNSGRVFLSLAPRGERPPAAEIIARLRRKLAAVEGFNVFMQPTQNIQIGGRQSKSLYQYTLQSGDLGELQLWSDKLQQALMAESGLLDVTTDLQLKSLQLAVQIDRDKAAGTGVTDADIRAALYAAYGNAQVATIYSQANDYAVILETPGKDRQEPRDILHLHVRSRNGTLVPLNTLVELAQTTGPLAVNHQGQLPAVTLSFNLAKGFALSEAIERIRTAERKIGMPATIVTSFQGTAQAFEASAAGQGFLLLAAILVIYIILGMLYESFIHPITILSGLPSAGLGAVLTLMLFGMELSVIAIIGIVLLIGIVKKNAIMMVDFAIDARRQGMAAAKAIEQACLLRFRPIMMTTMAALFGVLPIAAGYGAGYELRQPLGLAVVGGLLISQILTLYITPVVYIDLERFANFLAARRKKRP